MSNQSVEEKFPKASEYIKNLIREVFTECDIEPVYWDRERWMCRFRVKLRQYDNITGEVAFSEENMEDFEEVLKRRNNRGDSHDIRFTYYVRFKVYIEMGKLGMFSNPDFKISEIFLKENAERRDWWKDRYLAVSFDKKRSDYLYRGLEHIERFLSSEMSGLEEFFSEKEKEDLERTRSIIHYFKTHGSFEESTASIRSLSLLKAAAYCTVVELENQKGDPSALRLAANNRKICAIAEFMRDQFLEIPLPGWITQYKDVRF